jgi:hypothetical protein
MKEVYGIEFGEFRQFAALKGADESRQALARRRSKRQVWPWREQCWSHLARDV